MLKTNFCKIPLDNPLFLAAGVLGSNASSLNWILDSGAGGVVTKSFSINPNEGYKNPTTVAVDGGIINAIGLSNPGLEVFKEEIKKINSNDGKGVFASIYGSTPEEFSRLAGEIEGIVDAIELNISCPHAMCGYGASIGENPELTYEFVKAVTDTVSIPVIAKLTPNVTDITVSAVAAEEAGADGLSLINSLGPGMKIDLITANPILSNKFGGMSGPAIKPIAIKCVYDVYESVDIPIMGVGGISNYADVVEFLYAGANLVQIGTSIMDNGVEVFSNITKDLELFMKKNDFKTINEMIGLAHKEDL
ncbi:dihydroorotate dehydrogenase [Methanobrevibacter sp. DSM 116169]|uniref:dihydroorotate dehydrogenase n=1 Tax=Methanobrevibacter sp. DSM 116169 TaxID=3242727 RepID=UPI0038FC0AEC